MQLELGQTFKNDLKLKIEKKLYLYHDDVIKFLYQHLFITHDNDKSDAEIGKRQ